MYIQYDWFYVAYFTEAVSWGITLKGLYMAPVDGPKNLQFSSSQLIRLPKLIHNNIGGRYFDMSNSIT
jgi:hypothetical protein